MHQEGSAPQSVPRTHKALYMDPERDVALEKELIFSLLAEKQCCLCLQHEALSGWFRSPRSKVQ